MSLNKLNLNYKTSPPDEPEILGDRYYPQDIIRDRHYLTDYINQRAHVFGQTTGTKIINQLFGDVTVGVGVSLDIPSGSAIHKRNVSVPDSFASFPPTKKTEVQVIGFFWAARVNTPITGGQVDATLLANANTDGATTNYVKVRYKEANGPTRTRANAAGTYAYEIIDSYEFWIDDTAPTDFEISLMAFTSDGASIVLVPSGRDELHYPRGALSSFNANYEEASFLDESRFPGDVYRIRHGDGSTPAENEFDVNNKVLKGLLAGLVPGDAARLADFPFKNFVLITSTQTWTPPADVNKVYVEGGGGGGGGAGADESSAANGAGGGQGEVRAGLFSVTPSVGITVTIGGGGAGGAVVSNGSNGVSTTFGGLMTCTGGVGGQSAAAGGAGGSGGSGGSYIGSQKGKSKETSPTTIVGSFGGGEFGGSGRQTGEGAGDAGQLGGGGAGGARSSTTETAGGNGGDGYIKIWY